MSSLKPKKRLAFSDRKRAFSCSVSSFDLLTKSYDILYVIAVMVRG